jgi:DNA-binding MarR family transcriptional regulator
LLASLSALIALWDSPRLQREVLARTGETIDQPAHQVLRHLGFRGPLRPSRLAAELGTGASHVSKIIRRLEERELVERVRDPLDARATLIALTELGAEQTRHVFDLGDDLVAMVTNDWSAEDVAAYTALTARFTTDAVRAAKIMRESGIVRMNP